MSEQAPQNHNEQSQKNEPTRELIGFNDGGTALQWNIPGDVLEMGPGSKAKYLRFVGSHDLALLKTKSGNVYGMGHGLIINANTKKLFRAPDVFPDVTIGAPLDIPGVGSTSDIESLTVEYKYGDVAGVTEKIDRPSPFVDLRRALEDAQAKLDQSN